MHLRLNAIVLLLSITAISQNINSAISAGLPIGDTRYHHAFNLTLEVNYLWKISKSFDAGISTGYSYYFNSKTSDISHDDMSYLPISAAARFNLSKKFILGFDLGGTIGISGDCINEGVYFAPKMQYKIKDAMDLVIAHRSLLYDIVFGGSRDVVSIGLEFRL